MKRILEDLVEAARSGDRGRFDRLFDIWFTAVYVMNLRRVGWDPSLAQTLTQDALVESMRGALSTREGDCPEKSTNARDGRAAVR